MSTEKAYLKPIGKRLIAVREKRGFRNREQFAEAFGAPKKTFEKYEQGLTELPTKLMMWLRDEHHVNLTWLITGEGDMFDDTPLAPITVEPATVQQLVDTVGSLSQNLGSMAQRLEPPPPPPTTIRYLPLVASAGGGAAVLYESGTSDMDMDRLARDVFDMRPRDIMLMRIKGDSMEPTLKDGDFAVVDTSRPVVKGNPEDGRIYITSINGELYAKRADWYSNGNSFAWRSDNDLPQYAPIEVSSDEVDREVVIGEVLNIIRPVASRRRS